MMKEKVISLVSDFLAVRSFDFAAGENGDGKAYRSGTWFPKKDLRNLQTYILST